VLALNPNDQAAKQIQENMASTAKASTKAQPATQNKK
jgi:hypothetical protein